MNNLPPARDLPPGHHEARRAYLLSEMSGTRAPRRITPLRLAIGGMATAGLTAGIAAGLVLAPTGKVGGNAPGNAPLIRVENAADVFSLASVAAAKQPDLNPRPDQYLYFESLDRVSATPGRQGGVTRREAWLPVGGRRAGLLINKGGDAPGPTWICDKPQPGSGQDGKAVLLKADLKHPPQGCQDQPSFKGNLPTNAAAMRTWLYRHSKGGNPPDVQAFVTVGDTIRESYVPPAALSAMFTAAAKLPGATITKNVNDPAGRGGIAVGQTWHGIRHELIFDAKTYQLLGEREVVSYDNSFRPSGGKPEGKPSTPSPKMKEGTVLDSIALLKIAVTDKAGQAPTG
jgi:hypothetical protein